MSQTAGNRFPSRLILNADDFGLTPGINRAIADLHRAGVLSSATLMANGPAFGDAVSVARTLPGLGVGCHVVLTDGLPVSPPSAIPSLLGSDRSSLRPSLSSFARAALLHRLSEAEVEIEATAQIQRLLHAGIQPTHLDTHKHTHIFPRVLRPLLRVADRLGIPAIRNPFEQPWSLHLGRGRALRRLQIRLLGLFEARFHQQEQLRSGRIRTTDGSIGVSATGDLDRDTLALLLERLPSGTWEFVCHPGYADTALDSIATRLRGHRDREREALLAVVPPFLASSAAPRLISFAALGSPSPPGTQPGP